MCSQQKKSIEPLYNSKGFRRKWLPTGWKILLINWNRLPSGVKSMRANCSSTGITKHHKKQNYIFHFCAMIERSLSKLQLPQCTGET